MWSNLCRPHFQPEGSLNCKYFTKLNREFIPERVSPLQLPEGKLDDGTQLNIIGWEYIYSTKYGMSPPGFLKEASARVISRSEAEGSHNVEESDGLFFIGGEVEFCKVRCFGNLHVLDWASNIHRRMSKVSVSA